MHKNRTCGIYEIRCSINNKVYIGSSNWIERRWTEHKYFLVRNKHFNRHLQYAWNAYNCNNFTFKILETLEEEYKLPIKEKYWIDKFNSSNQEFGFNFASNPERSPMLGKTGILNHRYGTHLSDETKAKISQSNKKYKGSLHSRYGKEVSKETREKMRAKALQREYSEEEKDRLRKLNIGRKLTDEHKTAISNANAGENSYWYGKKLSEEHIQNMSQAHIGILVGSKHPLSKLSEEDVIEIRRLFSSGEKRPIDIVKQYGLSKTTVSHILRRITWTHI